MGRRSRNTPPRIFELRRYKSQTFNTLRRKSSMFTGSEMQIFQGLGMLPVFFGATIVGTKQPNLMYMLSYDDLAARKSFGSHSEAIPSGSKSALPPRREMQRLSRIPRTSSCSR